MLPWETMPQNGSKAPKRKTLIVPNRNAWRGYRTQSALDQAHGTQLMMINQLAARLAGGFLQPVDADDFKEAVSNSIKQPLGELDAIKGLPGFQRAAAATLEKMWEAGLDLGEELQSTPDKAVKSRLESIAGLEREILSRLPKNQIRSLDMVTAALKRIENTEKVFGTIEIRGFTEMSPVWRPLLDAMSRHTQVIWVAEARHHPDWLTSTGIMVSKAVPASPKVRAISCANPRHEILEAIRWSRKLLTEGVSPQDIAIAATSPDTWDDYVLALRDSSEIPIHFVHGLNALSTPEGQHCAALADILLHGFSRNRLIRFIALLRTLTSRFSPLPGNWSRSLQGDAPLLDADRWERAISELKPEDFSDGVDHTPELSEIVAALKKGSRHAADIGEILLENKSLSMWRKALAEGAAEALNETLASLRLEDGIDPGTAVIWAPASAVASFPRSYTWLVGLTSQSWPRRAGEDPLLPNHIVPAERLTPLPVHLADRRDFDTIQKMTTNELVCSRARRESEGRLYGISSLFPRTILEERLAQSREAGHALNESDRLMARPGEFSNLPSARTALGAWTNWHRCEITPHDGQVRKNHPLLIKALDRRQSASSLVKLMRDPIAYLWTYGFGWKEPENTDDPLNLDPADFGTLLHEILEGTVTLLEKTNRGGFGSADRESIVQAIEKAATKVRSDWEESRPIPPPFIWNLKVEEVSVIATNALTFQFDPLAGQRSWTEIPFGGDWKTKDLSPETLAELPWNPLLPVFIPGTRIQIGGSIDRLDLAGDRSSARVTDYKSGKLGGRPPQLKGGAELQRCLYAFAVKSLVSESLKIEAQLLYPRGEAKALLLDSPDETIAKLATYIQAATESFLAGNSLPGCAASDSYNGLALALPAGAGGRYLQLKNGKMIESLAALVPLWDEI